MNVRIRAISVIYFDALVFLFTVFVKKHLKRLCYNYYKFDTITFNVEKYTSFDEIVSIFR